MNLRILGVATTVFALTFGLLSCGTSPTTPATPPASPPPPVGPPTPPPVGPPPPPPATPGSVASLSLNPTTGRVPVGARVHFFAVARDKSGQLLDVAIQYGSSDTGVLSVGTDGTGDAKATGSAQVAASVDGKTASAALTVLAASSAPNAVSWLSTQPGTFLNIGDVAQLADGTLIAAQSYMNSASSAGAYGFYGLFRSSDSGATWTPLYASGVNGNVYQLLAHPTNANILWMLGYYGILKSTDAGLHWHNVLNVYFSNPDPTRGLRVHPFDSNVLYVNTWRSSDGGESWTNLSSIPGTMIVESPRSSNIIVSKINRTFKQSIDAGITWNALPLPTVIGTPTWDDVTYASDGTLYINGRINSRGLIYASTNDGASWAVRADIDGAPWYGSILTSAKDSNRLFLTHGNSELSTSGDGGKTWLTRTPSVSSPEPLFSFDSSLYLSSLQATILFNVTSTSVLRSSDSGLTWSSVGDLKGKVRFLGTRTFVASSSGLWVLPDGLSVFIRDSVNRGLTTWVPGAAVIDTRNPLRVLAGNVYSPLGSWNTTTDAGEMWNASSLPGLPIQVPSQPTHWYAIADHGDIYSSTDDASTWSVLGRVPYGDGVAQLVVSATNPSLVYALAQSGVYRSTDGARTWKWASNGLDGIGFTPGYSPSAQLALDSNNDQRLYLATGRKGMYRSLDGGASWTPLNTTLSNLETHRIAIASDGTLFAGTPDGGIYRSLDGTSWERASDGLQAYRITGLATDRTDANVVYASTEGGVWKSTAKGSNWVRASVGLTSPFANWVQVSNDGQTLYVGTEVGVFKGQPAVGPGVGFQTQSIPNVLHH